MATIVKRRGKDGKLSYQVKIRARGHPPLSATFARRTDARAYAQQVEAQIAEGRYFPQNEARRHTLADAIERYIERILPGKKHHTANQQRQQLGWWRERIGHLRLSDITPALIVEQRDGLAQATSNSTANRYMSVMSHLLTVCVRQWQWLQESPARHISKLREPQGRIRFLDESERERLLMACQASTHRFLYPVVMLALCTGCRKREITRLQWSQVAAGYQSITLTDTKNDEVRRVPIVEPALSVLREHARTPRRVVGCEWVFPGRTMRGPCDITKAWEVAVEAAGLDNFRFHDLRHTTASYLAMSGATPLEIAEILGHRGLDMVRRYAHLSESSVSETLGRAMREFF